MQTLNHSHFQILEGGGTTVGLERFMALASLVRSLHMPLHPRMTPGVWARLGALTDWKPILPHLRQLDISVDTAEDPTMAHLAGPALKELAIYLYATDGTAFSPVGECVAVFRQLVARAAGLEELLLCCTGTLFPADLFKPMIELQHLRKLNIDRKSTRLNSSHSGEPRMPSSA